MITPHRAYEPLVSRRGPVVVHSACSPSLPGTRRRVVWLEHLCYNGCIPLGIMRTLTPYSRPIAHRLGLQTPSPMMLQDGRRRPMHVPTDLNLPALVSLLQATATHLETAARF